MCCYAAMAEQKHVHVHADEKPHLIYDKTSEKLKLQTNGLRAGSTNETSITLLNSFNGKRVGFWLTKKRDGGRLYSKSISLKLFWNINTKFRISI